MTKIGLIKQLLDQECSHVSFDSDLLHRAILMQEGFVNKKADHVAFFGGSFTGVQTVRFTDSDRDLLFDTILESDESHLEHLLYNLKDEHGHLVVDQTHKRASDVFNIAAVYAIHRFHTSTELDEQQKLDGKTRVAMYMNYKFLTSLLYHYFPYPADPGVAAATYAQLSFKYLLKQQGSWGNTIRYLAGIMVAETSVHIRVIETMSHDYDVERLINDMQSRVKDVLKNIYVVFMQVHAHGEKITSTASHAEIEGEVELKDKTTSVGMYGRYVKSVIPDKNAFIKPELTGVVVNMMHTMPPRLLVQTLTWTSENYLSTRSNLIEESVDVTMEHAIEYLAANRDVAKTDLPSMLSRLRGAYMSSRSSDPRLLTARNQVEALVKQATGSKNNNAVASVRTAWMLYVVARAFTMRYYANH